MKTKTYGPRRGEDVFTYIRRSQAQGEEAPFYIATHVVWDRDKRSALWDGVTPAEFREMLARERGD